MKRFRKSAVALFAIAMTPVCVAFAAEDRVVATVGSHGITQQEVDAKIKPQLTSIDGQIYELRRRAIEAMADDYLLEQAAKKANLGVEAYMKREITDKVPAPPEADTKKFYETHKDQIKQPYDKVKPQLIDFMKRQAVDEQRNKLLDSLRAEQPLKIKLKAPRFKVAAIGPELGPKDAPVTIVEFADFQCPFCKRVEDSLKQIRAKYGDKVRLVYRDYPLPMHPNAMPAAEAARCAGEQGKFWPFHDALYSDQSKLAPNDLKATAAKLGLDKQKFDSCVDSKKYEGAVAKDRADGEAVGVEGTPAFFINGRSLSGAQPVGEFNDIIEDELSTPAAERVAHQ
jgi:protein-disulfide isomerase